MKNIVIVGAGIAGLSAGVYALQSGFDVTILEQHTIPGGNCTSWRREGYLFEGGLHWLTGSSPKTSLHQVWKNIGALNGQTKIFTDDAFYSYFYQGKRVTLYRDPDALEKHFLEVSPEDEKEIRAMCRDIRRFAKVAMPLQDVKGVKTKYKNKASLSSLFTMLPLIPKIMTYAKLSEKEFSERFKHPAIRALLRHAVGENLAATSLLLTLGCFASGDGGYVEGGSLVLAANVAKRFTELGGKILYGTHVEKVLVENGKAVGIVTGGKEMKADAVIVTVDAASAIDKLFDKPLQEPWTQRLRKNVKCMADTFIGLGVEADLSDLPRGMIFSPKKPVTIAGHEYTAFGLNNYACHPGYAPKGCTALTTFFVEDTYDYWKAKKERGEYEAEKEKVADTVIKVVEQVLPQIAGKIKVVNVATPLTYERYCGTYHGSWMTSVEKGDQMSMYPSVSESVGGLYFAGQRLQSPGGLPVAAETGRRAIQYLCKDTGIVFQGNE